MTSYVSLVPFTTVAQSIPPNVFAEMDRKVAAAVAGGVDVIDLAKGNPDAFPAEDLVLQNMLPTDGTRSTAKALRTHAEAWRPWRGYAVFHLWREAATSTPPRTATPARPRARPPRSPSP